MALVPASIAGLPGSGTRVLVGPVLSCSGARFGLTLRLSPAAVKPHVFALSRL